MGRKELRQAGLKVTSPRLKILAIMESAEPHHISAEEVYRQLIEMGDDIGLATVYRVLAQFETADIVRRHNFEGGRSVFEIEQGEHHDHLVCTACGRVEEFLDAVIEERQEKIAKNANFFMQYHHLTIYGECASCSKRSAP